jgi:hypothetical protein
MENIEITQSIELDNNSPAAIEIKTHHFNICDLDYLKETYLTKQNIYMNFLFFFINNHYESIINNVNFFHFATEALIWELFKSSTHDGRDNLKQLMSANIDPASFCNSVKILTGSSHHYEAKAKLSELQLAKLFLERLNYYRSQADYDPDFAEAFRDITRKTVSSCLVKLLGVIGGSNGGSAAVDLIQDDLFFFNAFRELKENKGLTLVAYLNVLEKVVGKKITKNDQLMMFIKSYYYYARTTYNDYLFDLELFYDHSVSLFSKLKKYSRKNIDNINNYVATTKVYHQLSGFYTYISTYMLDGSSYFASKVYTFKIWINNSIHYAPNFFLTTYNTTKLMLYDKIIAPSKNFIVLYTDKSVTFILTNLNNVETAMTEVSGFILEKAEEFMDNFEEQVNQKDLFVRFTHDEKVNYLKVDIDNSVVMFNSGRFKEYVRNVYTQLMKFSGRVYSDSKIFLLDKYKNFLNEC